MTQKNGDWTIKHTEKIFANDFFEVQQDQVIKPNGEEGEFTTIAFRDGVALLAIDDEKNIYLTRQFRYALGRDDLEIAAGIIENENDVEATKREALEELGIKAEDWIDFGRIEENTSITKSAARLFLARKLTFTKPQPEDTEEIIIVKMPLEEAVAQVMSGEITHDLTCILILKTSFYLKDD